MSGSNDIRLDRIRLDRRGLILSSLAATACVRDAASANPPPRIVADSHVHLFNASDLPIEGFLKYVVFPGDAASAPDWAAALIDMFAAFYKPQAVTATAENGPSQGLSPERDPQAFGLAAAQFIDQRVEARQALDSGSASLRSSYEALCRALADGTGVPRPAGKAMIAEGSQITAKAFERAAESASSELELPARRARDLGTASAGPCACDTPEPSDHGIDRAVRLIGWGYILTNSRRSHLRRYVDRFASSDRVPRLLACLLIDYDYWLDDHPSAGSSMVDQLATMAIIKKDLSGLADIRMFAGVCPLKLALQTEGSKPRLFDQIKEMHARGEVHGLKLYPPMGFRPLGNSELPDDAFDPRAKGRTTALAQWRATAGNKPLGPALDAALEEIYAFAEHAKAPIVAHAGPGNEAGPGYGQRANPIFWERVVARYRIRLSLGHLVNDTQPFLCAAAAGKPYPACVWSLQGSLRMLDRRPDHAPDVYGDLAYMPELIDDPALAKAFFVTLRKVFSPGDPDLTRVLYGTDWIMLGQERHDTRFLTKIEAGMQAASYTPDQIENILHRNAERFLS